MKVVLSWLRELCPTDLSADELAERLTAQGVKVEAVLRPWERLSGVTVARVLEVRDHPDAEKLCRCRVDTGAGQREVVVGVRNMRPGDLVPLAGPGATVPGLPEPLGRRKIRGVVSDGMLCSPRELGVSAEHTGILVLPPEAPLGADVKALLGLDDAVLDIEVKSNRPDLLSVAGVAREAAAATGAPFTPPDASVAEGDEKADAAATVEVLDGERCPRYLARVIRGVTLGPSPIEVQARLTAAGMRPLSNVVDATNYVMLETGQPLHPFDLALLHGAGIVVRRAEEGETLVTLDEVERRLSPEDLVIADLAKGVAIAGVMGSASAEVGAGTADVLLESAHFERRGVLRTSRRLGLQTEASVRFGRGADPEGVGPAADRAARLIAEWAGGTVLAGAVDRGEAPARRHVGVRADRATALLGYEVTAGEATEALARLGLSVKERRGTVEAEIPGYRGDLELEEDLVEEVARLLGYDRVPERLVPVRQPGGVGPGILLRNQVREAMVRAGLREALSYSFASAEDLALLGHPEALAVRVANPLAADQAFLRPGLLPGLLRSVGLNLSRQVRGVALFEVGRVFSLREGEPGVDERERVGLAVAGSASAGWPERPRDFDFYDAKGAVAGLLGSLGLAGWSLGGPAGRPLHPARSAEIVVAGGPVGMVGELHPRVAQRLELPPRTAVAEVELTALSAVRAPSETVDDVPRFPPVRRDLAFVVDRAVAAGAVRDAIVAASGGVVREAVLFDVFEGPPVPEGRKSLAYSVDLRAPDRTLTDEDAEAVVRTIVARLHGEFGAELRSG